MHVSAFLRGLPIYEVTMAQYYECHVTMVANRDMFPTIKANVDKLSWKFSAIDGDPSLGEGVKCYATKHFRANMDPTTVLEKLNETADEITKSGVEVVRRKIELVIYDDRAKTVQLPKCNGGCPGCHLDDLN